MVPADRYVECIDIRSCHCYRTYLCIGILRSAFGTWDQGIVYFGTMMARYVGPQHVGWSRPGWIPTQRRPTYIASRMVSPLFFLVVPFFYLFKVLSLPPSLLFSQKGFLGGRFLTERRSRWNSRSGEWFAT